MACESESKEKCSSPVVFQELLWFSSYGFRSGGGDLTQDVLALGGSGAEERSFVREQNVGSWYHLMSFLCLCEYRRRYPVTKPSGRMRAGMLAAPEHWTCSLWFRPHSCCSQAVKDEYVFQEMRGILCIYRCYTFHFNATCAETSSAALTKPSIVKS